MQSLVVISYSCFLRLLFGSNQNNLVKKNKIAGTKIAVTDLISDG
jgi:hypothetical protein